MNPNYLNHFIKNCCSILALLLGIVIALELSISSFLYNNANFKLSPDTAFIAIGHSHPECSLNDTLLHRFINLGQSGESYFYNYIKLKKVLAQTPSIETVFIEMTNNHIAKTANKNIWFDKYISNSLPRFSPFMDFQDHTLLIKNNKSGYLSAFRKSLREKLDRVARNDLDFTDEIGGYFHYDRFDVDSLLNVLANEGSSREDTFEGSMTISKSSIEYLTKMIELCQEQGRSVILMRSPVHPKWEGLLNEKVYLEFIETQKKKYPNIEYVDFARFPLLDNDFADLHHLNFKGAEKYTMWFAELLKNGFLTAEDKQLFIDKRMIKDNFSELKNLKIKVKNNGQS